MSSEYSPLTSFDLPPCHARTQPIDASHRLPLTIRHETSESESSTLSSPTSSSDRTSQRHPDPTSSPTPEHLNPTCNMPIMTEEHHEGKAQEKQDLVAILPLSIALVNPTG